MVHKFGILVVDDDVGLASNLQDILRGEGYNVEVAHDGQEALILCRESVFDLVLGDIKLPDLPGTKLVEELAGLSPVTDCIIITGYASLESAVEAVRGRNIVGYETKPLNMDRLLYLTRQVLERKRAEEVLKSERGKLKAIVDGLALTGIGIDIVGTDYKVHFQNQVLQERFGDLTGKLCYENYMGLERPNVEK